MSSLIVSNPSKMYLPIFWQPNAFPLVYIYIYKLIRYIHLIHLFRFPPLWTPPIFPKKIEIPEPGCRRPRPRAHGCVPHPKIRPWRRQRHRCRDFVQLVVQTYISFILWELWEPKTQKSISGKKLSTLESYFQKSLRLATATKYAIAFGDFPTWLRVGCWVLFRVSQVWDSDFRTKKLPSVWPQV